MPQPVSTMGKLEWQWSLGCKSCFLIKKFPFSSLRGESWPPCFSLGFCFLSHWWFGQRLATGTCQKDLTLPESLGLQAMGTQGIRICWGQPAISFSAFTYLVYSLLLPLVFMSFNWEKTQKAKPKPKLSCPLCPQDKVIKCCRTGFQVHQQHLGILLLTD
jgi:hypothetical protein